MGEVLPLERGVELERRGYTRPCRHRAVALLAAERQVICRRCHKVLDPFDVLLVYADLGAKQAARLPDAEEAEALLAELVDRRGRLTTSARGVVATIKSGGRQLSSTVQWGGRSFYASARQAIIQVLEKARWSEGRERNQRTR